MKNLYRMAVVPKAPDWSQYSCGIYRPLRVAMKPEIDPKRDLEGATPETLARAVLKHQDEDFK